MAKRTMQWAEIDGRRRLLVAGKVNRFIPNPTFDPIIVAGCMDVMFRGQVPEGVDPRSLAQVEPLRAEYQNRDARLAVHEAEGRLLARSPAHERCLCG